MRGPWTSRRMASSKRFRPMSGCTDFAAWQGTIFCRWINRPYHRVRSKSINQFHNLPMFMIYQLRSKIREQVLLTLFQITQFRLFQTERASRRQFQVWWKWQTIVQKGRKHCSDSSKLKELADDNFKFDENGKPFSKRVGNSLGFNKFSEWVENTVGKGEIAP